MLGSLPDDEDPTLGGSRKNERPKLPAAENIHDLRQRVQDDIMKEEQLNVLRQSEHSNPEASGPDEAALAGPNNVAMDENNRRNIQGNEETPLEQVTMTDLKQDGAFENSLTQQYQRKVKVDEELHQGYDQSFQETGPGNVGPPHELQQDGAEAGDGQFGGYVDYVYGPVPHTPLSQNEDLEIFRIFFELFDHEKIGYIQMQDLLCIMQGYCGQDQDTIRSLLRRLYQENGFEDAGLSR